MKRRAWKKILAKTPDYNPEAYALYLKARKILMDFGHEQFALVRDLLDRALLLDSTNPNIYAELANYYLFKGTALGDMSHEIALQKAMPLLDKAFAIDPKNGDAYGYLARGKMWMEWDFEGARLAFDKAHEYQGDWRLRTMLNIYIGQIEDAKLDLKEIKILDPQYPYIAIFSGMLYFFEANLEQSFEEFQYLLAANPQVYDSYRFLAKIHMQRENYEEAIKILETATDELSNRAPYLIGDLAIAYHKVGADDKANRIIEELTENWKHTKIGSPAFFLGLIYANTGEKDKAFEWLEKSFEAREVEMVWLKMDPFTKPLHDDPRYQNLLERVGFP